MTLPHCLTLLCASFAAVALAAGWPAASDGPGAADAPGAAPGAAYVQWVGPDSKHPAPGFVLVGDDAAWRALWAAHTGTPEARAGRHGAPKIDFGSCMVVAHFRGPSVNHDGEVLASLDLGGDVVRLRFESWSFQTSGPDGRGGAVETTPYGIWVVPRSDAPIVVERRSEGLKSDPVRWVEAHRFAGR
jgi:hypothetical protein